MLARRIQGAAEVTLRSAPLLECRLAIDPSENHRLVLADGETIVAEAGRASLRLDPRPAVEFDEAQAASSGFAGFTEHPFPMCFACGPDRSEGDGLRLFPGADRAS